jgi:iron complex outermembrane receptor protein
VLPSLTAYGTVARGAKAGGFPFFNQSAAFGVPNQPFERSATWSYETGLRGRLLDGRLELGASVFFNDTADEQLFIFNPAAGQFQVENADTESYGAELELAATPADGLSVRGSLGLLDTQVTAAPAGGTVRAGNDVPYAPSVTASLGAEYRVPARPLALPGHFTFAADYEYVGSRAIDPANTARLEAYDLVNMRLGWEGRNVDVYAFASNVLNEEFAVSGFRAGSAPDGSPVIGGTPGMPRTFGIGARLRF